MDTPPPRDLTTCPFVDLADPRCQSHFSLTHLNNTFSICFHQYRTCSHYQDILNQQTPITIHGQRLKPTGS